MKSPEQGAYPDPPEPSKEEISTLRSSAKEKFEELGLSTFDSRDVARLNTDDGYVRRFLMHVDNDQTQALTMVVDTFKWRKENAVNDITSETVNQNLFELGNLFVHNYDSDGCRMLIFIVSKHVKGVTNMDDLKEFLIFWMERLEREEYGKFITVFFDMTKTGMKNMDMEFIQYLINLFKSYYPWILNNIIVYDMPWILNAMWKIISTWLPPKSLAKIKFLKPATLTTHVTLDQSLVSWGGTDDYTFVFEPEQQRPLPWSTAGEQEAKKQVTFSDSTVTGVPALRTSGITLITAQQKGAAVQVQLSPSEELLFNCDKAGATATITITNTNTQPIFFKVKTTSPEKFRVRPSVGALNSGGSATVTVGLGEQGTISHSLLVREKFLVMTIAATSDTVNPQDITAAFKAAPKESVSEVRLRVGVSSSANAQNGITPQHSPTETKMLAKLDDLVRIQRSLLDQQHSTRRLLYVTVLLLFLLVVFMLVTYNGVLHSTSSTLPSQSIGYNAHDSQLYTQEL
uniref:Motile sperm domain-containing protein 2-like n=1 Tax=Hirondellea gigas TaxID=1518452 RepID=A0A2P2I585_9CRUS